eukprot:GHUV01037857.1.p1 GENE.GHUV01037857.1~~GHUV01037857.1.p1  ORF type:complete len:130 (-),score=24.76 GHUV01037857.1:347-736(-)
MESTTVPSVMELLASAFQTKGFRGSDEPPPFVGGEVARRLGTAGSEFNLLRPHLCLLQREDMLLSSSLNTSRATVSQQSLLGVGAISMIEVISAITRHNHPGEAPLLCSAVLSTLLKGPAVLPSLQISC